MKEHISLFSSESQAALRSITTQDLENLRTWKNEHRAVFFYQRVITPEQQLQWFQGYLERPDDFMFIVSEATQAIGCMGFRIIDQRADIYNVILGRPESGGKGLMSQSIRLMCSYVAAHYSRDIGAQVLSANPARAWYRKNAFRETGVFDNYVQVQLDWQQFCPCSFQIAAGDTKREKI
jgi:RimJ/RimL family protein N-acetyltransferase